MDAYISGIGWVFPNSYGNRENSSINKEKSPKLPLLNRKDVLDKPYKPFGRMDCFSKLGFASISYALKDAGLNQKVDIDKKNTAIIASTVLGCLDTDVKYYDSVLTDGGKCASPALFAYTLPNCLLGEASIYYGFTGESFVINEGKTSGLRGLSMALEVLESGLSDVVVCGICDTVKPDIKDFNGNQIPGSLFFVIEKEKRDDVYCYGKIEEKGDDNILLHNGENIPELLSLAEKCLDRLLHNAINKI